MSAKTSTLEKLHEMLAELFIEDIKLCREEGIPMAASDKGVIVSFLKNNNITADPDLEDMQRLDEEFKRQAEIERVARAKSMLEQKGDDRFDDLLN